MAEDPRAKLFFDQWEKDFHEGITLRAIKMQVDSYERRFRAHVANTEKQFREHSGEIAKIKERIAKVETNDERDAEERTGRFSSTPSGIHIPIGQPTPSRPIAVPFQLNPGPVIHVAGGSVKGARVGSATVSSSSPRSEGHHKASSSASLGILTSPIQKALGYGLTAIVAAGITMVLNRQPERIERPEHVAAHAAAPPSVDAYPPTPAPAPHMELDAGPSAGAPPPRAR